MRIKILRFIDLDSSSLKEVTAMRAIWGVCFLWIYRTRLIEKTVGGDIFSSPIFRPGQAIENCARNTTTLQRSFLSSNISSVFNHSTLEFRDFSKRAPGS